MPPIVARYDPAPDQERAALSIHALAIDHLHEYRLVQPHGTADWVVIQFHEPIPVLLADGEQVVPAETAVLWEPHSPTAYGRAGHRARHSWLRCRSTLMAAWLAETGLRPRTALPVHDPAGLAPWWQVVHSECSTGAHRDPLLVQGLMRLLLRRLRPLEDAQHIPDGLRTAHRYLAEHWQRPLRLDGLARIAGMGRSTFCAAFRTAYGVPPLTLVQRLRLEHARTLLEDPSRTVADIAVACGFSEPCHFSRLFRARFGHSPDRWRRRGGSGTHTAP